MVAIVLLIITYLVLAYTIIKIYELRIDIVYSETTRVLLWYTVGNKRSYKQLLEF